jgi:Antirestriction protein
VLTGGPALYPWLGCAEPAPGTRKSTIGAFMRQLAKDYSGGYWHFYELSNGGFYMAPECEPLILLVAGNGYAGRMSAEAAGITACLFAFSHLSFRIPDEVIGCHYHQLRDFALEHPEASAILAAID